VLAGIALPKFDKSGKKSGSFFQKWLEETCVCSICRSPTEPSETLRFSVDYPSICSNIESYFRQKHVRDHTLKRFFTVFQFCYFTPLKKSFVTGVNSTTMNTPTASTSSSMESTTSSGMFKNVFGFNIQHWNNLPSAIQHFTKENKYLYFILKKHLAKIWKTWGVFLNLNKISFLCIEHIVRQH